VVSAPAFSDYDFPPDEPEVRTFEIPRTGIISNENARVPQVEDSGNSGSSGMGIAAGGVANSPRPPFVPVSPVGSRVTHPREAPIHDVTAVDGKCCARAIGGVL
jgi:hypothetical protein